MSQHIGNDLVSIIVPIYNVEKYLNRCINSIIGQSYKNVEIILVNDCSTDHSPRIAKEYAKKYKFCIYYEHSINKGLAASRNTGVSICNGKWMFFLDSDDWLHENAIEIMIRSAVMYDSDIVMCGYCYAWDDGKIKKVDSFRNVSTTSSQSDKIALIPQASATRRLYRKEFYSSCGFVFPENIKRGEDIPLTIPLLVRTEKISIVPNGLYYYYQRKGSISNSSVQDFSFYDDILNLTLKRCGNHCLKEVEFRMILEIVYAKTMLMIKAKKTNEQIIQELNKFQEEFPDWKYNPYIKSCEYLKSIYIKAAARNYIVLLRLFVYLWTSISRG